MLLKTHAQYWRVLLVGIVLLGILALLIFTTRRRDLLQVSIVRPYSVAPALSLDLRADDESTQLQLSTRVVIEAGESVLWKNATPEATLQITGSEFASPHLDPEEAFQLEFIKPGIYTYAVSGLGTEKKSYQIVVEDNQ